MTKQTLEEKILEVLHAYHPAGADDTLLAKDMAALFKDHYHRGQRIRESHEKARAEGKKIGRPPGEDVTPIVVALLEQGKSVREIEAETGINRGKVARIRKHHYALDLV